MDSTSIIADPLLTLSHELPVTHSQSPALTPCTPTTVELLQLESAMKNKLSYTEVGGTGNEIVGSVVPIAL